MRIDTLFVCCVRDKGKYEGARPIGSTKRLASTRPIALEEEEREAEEVEEATPRRRPSSSCERERTADPGVDERRSKRMKRSRLV